MWDNGTAADKDTGGSAGGSSVQNSGEESNLHISHATLANNACPGLIASKGKSKLLLAHSKRWTMQIWINPCEIKSNFE